ncbi:MAG: hypothetical protein JEY99_06405 [Spirochaetales bacterium]|nr:hypothetical protein [Spirochaetales bacterium]
MKKTIIILLVLAGLTFGLVAENMESNLYYKSYPISLINPSTEGYRIVYMKSNMDYHVFYCPMEWFIGAASKGDILYGEGAAYPYFTVYWEDGKFSHIKLYLHKNRTDSTWGDFPEGRDYSEKFNVEEPLLEF